LCSIWLEDLVDEIADWPLTPELAHRCQARAYASATASCASARSPPEAA
jgi:hypothetical protein